MKKVLALLLALVMVVGMVACTPADGTTTNNNDSTTNNNNDNTTSGGTTEVDYNTLLAGDYGKINIWVSESDGVLEMFEKEIAAFQTKYPDIKFEVNIQKVGEGDAATQVIADVASAPDIYCFAQDQLARLVQSAALSAPSGVLIDTIKAENSATSVSAASVGGTIYAYPLTADNGFYMYYNTSILSEEDMEDLATIVAKVEAYNKENGTNLKIRYALENAWYNAGFFFATGCTSTWSQNSEGKWTGIEDNFNSDNGLIAMKGMQILTSSSAYESDADSFTDAAVMVTGTWNAKKAAEFFVENLGATDMPSFTVDGNSYHISSYLGCKLMGVKPQSDATKQNVLHLLALYLTNEENQLDHYETIGWGPSNLAAQENEAVKADISLVALNKQSEYAVSQGNINGSWWDIGALLGSQAKAAKSDAELKKALQDYEDAINAVLNKSEEELAAWGIIGGICGTNWDTDFTMTKQDDGTYLSDKLTLNAGEEFKLRQGGDWNVQVGKANDNTGSTASGYYFRTEGSKPDTSNIVVETTGTYQIKLTINADNTVNVEFIAA